MSRPNLNHSIRREHGFETLTVEGRIPDGLRGTLYRTGPGLLERFGKPVAHPFDADGAVTAVRLFETASGASRVVKSPEFLEEERQGRFLYSTSASWTQKLKNNLTRHVKSTGNTNLLDWGGGLFALMEGAKPILIDRDTLETGAVEDLGVIPDAFSAHPHRVESLKTTFNFGIRGAIKFGAPRFFVDLFALPDVGPAKRVGSFEAPWETMIHDFIATEKHLVFFIGPAKLVGWRALLGIGDLSTWFAWAPQMGMAIVVVPLDDPSRHTRIDVDPFWVWHFVNAYEDGGEIVVDAIRHDDFGAFAAPSSAGPEQAMPAYFRYRINLARKTARGEALWTAPCEFPSVHPGVAGARHRYAWLQAFKETDEVGGGVARLDTQSGELRRWRAPAGHLECEPVFVANGAGEEAGWVLQLIQDPEAARSYLAILDAERLEDGPVARAWFNQAIPMTFHGIFVRA